MLLGSRFAAIGLSFLFLACQTQNRNQRSLSEVKIVDGVETSAYENVGTLIGYNQFCTATLISPKVALTAAHCLQYLRSPGFIDSATFSINKTNYRSAKLLVHPEYKKDVANHNDIALVILERAVTNITPALLGSEQPKVGQVAELVGWGADGQSPASAEMPHGFPTGEGFKRVASIPIHEVSKNWFKFLGEKGTWHGDSGGPSFTRVGNDLILSGVHATAELRAWSVDLNVASYCQWIKDNTTDHPLRIQSGDCEAPAAALVNAP